ncbi:hypothetical protein [Pseudomonas sp. LB1P83]
MPFILLTIEYCLKSALNTDTLDFVGPTLATAAVGLLIPCLSPKSRPSALSPDIVAELKRLKVSPRSNVDDAFVVIAILLILCFISAWTFSLVLVGKKTPFLILGYDAPIWIGFACYFAGVVIAEIKEAI